MVSGTEPEGSGGIHNRCAFCHSPHRTIPASQADVFVPDSTRRNASLRFSIVYVDDGDVVSIVAVVHNKRMPGYWGKRL
jgi:hypothetical protein